MTTHFKGILFTVGLALCGAIPAQAAVVGISVTTFSPAAFKSAYKTELDSLIFGSVVENFESEGKAKGKGQVGPQLATDVGTFASLGGTGSGGSALGNGTQLSLRDGPAFGRVNTTQGGAWFLDSNDTLGMSWAVATGNLFDKVVFALTDASDQGATLKIIAEDGNSQSVTIGKNGGSLLQLVVVTFSDLVKSARIDLTNGKARNDGFGIDDAAVGATIAPVPLPAGLLLLGTAVGGFVVARRLRKA